MTENLNMNEQKIYMFGKEFFLSDKKSHESRFPARFKNEIGRIYLSRIDQEAPFCVAIRDNVRSPQINFCVGPDIHFCRIQFQKMNCVIFLYNALNIPLFFLIGHCL